MIGAQALSSFGEGELLSGCDEEGLLCYGTTSTCQGSAAAARGPYSLGLAAVAHELSYGIFLDQGLNPCSLHWQADSLPLDHLGVLIIKDIFPVFEKLHL